MAGQRADVAQFASTVESSRLTRSNDILVQIDLARVIANAIAIRKQVGVDVLAVVKADAYGLGASQVVSALASVVDGFCVFSLREAMDANGGRPMPKPTLALGPCEPAELWAYKTLNVRPSVWDAGHAETLRDCRPVLAVDTGMQRFACPADQCAAVFEAGQCDEAFTHATTLPRVQLLRDIVGPWCLKLHAAGTSLLNEKSAWLDAVRPGLALYRGAVRVTARLIDCRKTMGQAGYTNFTSPHHGVFLGGYSNGLRAGPCLINGRQSRVIEVGMQSAYVETYADDRAGDEVVLLGDGLSEETLAQAWGVGAHELLVRLCGAGQRKYI